METAFYNLTKNIYSLFLKDVSGCRFLPHDMCKLFQFPDSSTEGIS